MQNLFCYLVLVFYQYSCNMSRGSKGNCFNHDDSDNGYDSSEDYMIEDNTNYYSEWEGGNIPFFREVGLSDSDDPSSSDDEDNLP